MPYSNIVFIKIFLSLFEEDDRFLYQLNESQQLLYIKMLYMAGSTQNKIPKNTRFIRNKINYHHEDQCFLSDIERIRSVFQKFKESDEYYYFENFEELHNFIAGKSKGTPKECQRIVPEKSKSKSKRREDSSVPTAQLSSDLFLKKIRETYDWVDMDTEFKKMDTWLLAHPGRKKTQRFVVNWLNKVDKPVAGSMGRRLTA